MKPSEGMIMQMTLKCGFWITFIGVKSNEEYFMYVWIDKMPDHWFQLTGLYWSEILVIFLYWISLQASETCIILTFAVSNTFVIYHWKVPSYHPLRSPWQRNTEKNCWNILALDLTSCSQSPTCQSKDLQTFWSEGINCINRVLTQKYCLQIDIKAKMQSCRYVLRADCFVLHVHTLLCFPRCD